MELFFNHVHDFLTCKVDGRIIKLLDSIKNHDAEQKHLEIERERLEFAKQKIKGVFSFDKDGKVVPEEDEDKVLRE